MAEVKWIKLDVSIPDNKKIKRIRKMPDGNNIVLFWVFLLSRAGESNQKGGLFFTENVPYTEDDLAADFDFSTEFVRFAIMTLEKYKMIELYDHIIFIKNWDEYQKMDKLEKLQEQNRVRQANYREKQKLIANSNVTSNGKVTEDNATDIELDIELDIDKENKETVEKLEDIPYKEIVDYLNEKAGRQFRLVDKTKTLIKARWNEGQRLDDFKKVVDIKIKHANDSNNLFNETYLQPSTLFGNKFDEYRNQFIASKPKNVSKQKTWEEQLIEDGAV